MKRTLTSGDCSEQLGSILASGALNEILGASCQAERGDILKTAILELQKLPHPKRAVGGFSGVLVNVLERGLGVAK